MGTERKLVAERLVELRAEHRRTQQECADALGVAQSTYADMEAGRCRVRRRDLVTLAVLYETSPEAAFDGFLTAEVA